MTTRCRAHSSTGTAALAVFTDRNATADQMAAFNVLGLIAGREDDDTAAVELHSKALDLAIGPALRRERAVTLNFLSRSNARLGNQKVARKLTDQARMLFSDIGDSKSFIDTTIGLSRLNLADSDDDVRLAQAAHLCDEAFNAFDMCSLPVDGNLLHHRMAALKSSFTRG